MQDCPKPTPNLLIFNEKKDTRKKVRYIFLYNISICDFYLEENKITSIAPPPMNGGKKTHKTFCEFTKASFWRIFFT